MHDLTPATRQRAVEGLAAARDRAVRRAIEKAWAQLPARAAEPAEPRLSSQCRRLVVRLLIHSLFRVEVESPQQIPCSPAILAANHLNHLDPFLLLSELPVSPYCYLLGDARSLYNKGWKRLILGLAGGAIPLQRRWGEETAILEAVQGGAREADLVELAAAIAQDVPSGGDLVTLRRLDRTIKAILARGDSLVLFPEGRLGKIEGKLALPLQQGTARYALQAGLPIIPIALIGTNNLYWRKKLTLRFGDPLVFTQQQHPRRQDLESVLAALQQALEKLLPADYQEPDELKLFSHFLNHLFW